MRLPHLIYFSLLAGTGVAAPTPGESPLLNEWTLVTEDNFARPDTTPPESIGNGWVDSSKTWRLLNHTLVPTLAATNPGDMGPVRPKEENQLEQAAEITTGPLPESDTIKNIPYNLLLRAKPTTGFRTNYTIQLRLNPKEQTGLVMIAGGNPNGADGGEMGPSFPIQTGHSYVLTATARSLYPGGSTLLNYTVADAASPGIPLMAGQSHLVPPRRAHLTQPGTIGLQQERSDLTRSDLNVITRFRSFTRPPGALNAVVNTLPAATEGNEVTFYSPAAPWNKAAPQFAESGLAGCRITAQEVLAPNLVRLTVATGPETGLLQLTDPTSGGSWTLAVVKDSQPLAVTQLIPGANGENVQIRAGLIAGGKPPYQYQWHRSTDWTFTPDANSQLAGATAIDLTDAPPDNQCYAYKLIVTDAAGQTAISPSAPGMRNWKPATDPLAVANATALPALRIGWIGDSISSGSSQNVEFTLAHLQKAGVTVAASVNQAKGGAFTGSGKNGWLPGAESGLYDKAIAAFREANVNVIMLMLGTNDMLAFNVPVETYRSNLNTILAQLAKDLPGVTVILNTPVFGARVLGSKDGNQSLVSLVATLDQIAAENPNAVRGDRSMLQASYSHFDEYADELHPSPAGSDRYARYWAAALLRYLQTPKT